MAFRRYLTAKLGLAPSRAVASRLKSRFFQAALRRHASTTTKLCRRPKVITTRVGHRAQRIEARSRDLDDSNDPRFALFDNFRGGGDGGDQPEVLLGRWPGQSCLSSAICNPPLTGFPIRQTVSSDCRPTTLAFSSFFWRPRVVCRGHEARNRLPRPQLLRFHFGEIHQQPRPWRTYISPTRAHRSRRSRRFSLD